MSDSDLPCSDDPRGAGSAQNSLLEFREQNAQAGNLLYDPTAGSKRTEREPTPAYWPHRRRPQCSTVDSDLPAQAIGSSVVGIVLKTQSRPVVRFLRPQLLLPVHFSTYLRLLGR